MGDNLKAVTPQNYVITSNFGSKDYSQISSGEHSGDRTHEVSSEYRTNINSQNHSKANKIHLLNRVNTK